MVDKVLGYIAVLLAVGAMVYFVGRVFTSDKKFTKAVPAIYYHYEGR
jgi:hypothetical protein